MKTLSAALMLYFLASVVSATELASFRFDDYQLASGPDSYQVFYHPNARAEISSLYARSGSASAHLTDQTDDNDFVEFQGYFPSQSRGILQLSFSVLLGRSDGIFTFALVGKDRYVLTPQGINFWIDYRDGWFHHLSDGIPKKLIQPSPLEWYTFRALLNLDRGSYELQLYNESGKQVANLKDQPFAPGSSPLYSLEEFSFIGDIADRLPTDIFIDDLIIATSQETTIQPWVAPGRREFFVDRWNRFNQQLQGQLRCIPAAGLDDFAIDTEFFAKLTDAGHLGILLDLTRPQADPSRIKGWQAYPELVAIARWTEACNALEENQPLIAQSKIRAAIEQMPSAYIYQLTSLIVDAANHHPYPEIADRAWSMPMVEPDIRNAIALAMIAFHTRAAAEAETAIRDTARQGFAILTPATRQQLKKLGVQPVGRDYRQQLKLYMPGQWESALRWMVAIEQNYYALLWQKRFQDAYELASEMTSLLQRSAIEPGIWAERQGDAAFFMDQPFEALQHYKMLDHPGYPSNLLATKLADAYHALGNREMEQYYREKIYQSFTAEGE